MSSGPETGWCCIPLCSLGPDTLDKERRNKVGVQRINRWGPVSYVQVPMTKHSIEVLWKNRNLLLMVLGCHKSKIKAFGMWQGSALFASGSEFTCCTLTVTVLMRNVPHSLRGLHTWSPLGGTLWGGDTAFLEEVCRQRGDLRYYSPHIQTSCAGEFSCQLDRG